MILFFSIVRVPPISYIVCSIWSESLLKLCQRLWQMLSTQSRMSGDMQLELWLHEYKMDALSSVEKPMQEMLIDLYAELVPHEVQQEIRTRIDSHLSA